MVTIIGDNAWCHGCGDRADICTCNPAAIAAQAESDRAAIERAERYMATYRPAPVVKAASYVNHPKTPPTYWPVSKTPFERAVEELAGLLL